MLRTRVIPILQLRNECLVKTIQFDRFTYIGDPSNTVRIFNELEVDELIFLDITATEESRSPNMKVLNDIANECFMPLGYGGGVRDFETAKTIFKCGFEKIAVNSYAHENPGFITKLSEHYGAQAVIASIDVKRNLWGNYHVYTHSGRKKTDLSPVEWSQELEERGAGEILLTSINREGSWEGFDIELVKQVTQAVNIPVIAHGGAGCVEDIGTVVRDGGASAVGLGSLVVFQKKGLGVLVNYPDEELLAKQLD